VLVVEGDRPFFERSLAPANALWLALHGLDVWPSGVVRDDRIVPTAGLETWLADEQVARAVRLVAAGEPATVVVSADSEDVALGRGAALAAVAGVAAVSLLLPEREDAALEGAVSAHALTRGVVPVVRIAAAEPPARIPVPALAEHPGPVVLCVRTGTAPNTLQRPVLAVAAERPSPADRRRMWRTALPQLASEAPRLASRHLVEPIIAAASARDVAAIEALEGRTATVDDVAASVRGRAGLSLSSGVKLLRPTAAWEQLVLPEASQKQLRDAAARLVNQTRVLDDWGFLHGRPGARGVRMLFSGPPGTGKTLSAEVLAHQLGVELLVVDLARVVSKWIGETEKNLAEVFDAAERAEAVLFFDEADALFGKRTEVSDAHDRYANLETAYLLTRLERFEGLAVLATNLRQNVDQAFLRRVEFVVDFEEPTVQERVALWRCHLPVGAPVDEDVDLEELAALYPIVGALIRNAAVAAAFVAASESSVIGRNHLLSAIEREYQKSGRAFPGLPHVVHT
jgi:hypothetical protein